MAMSRKHYKALAEAIRAAHAHLAPPHNEVTRKLAHDVATFCGEDNPNFNRGRFLDACKLRNEQC